MGCCQDGCHCKGHRSRRGASDQGHIDEPLLTWDGEEIETIMATAAMLGLTLPDFIREAISRAVREANFTTASELGNHALREALSKSIDGGQDGIASR